MASTDLSSSVVAVNAFCRCCQVNMREAGLYSHSIDIFRKGPKPETIAERVAKLGLWILHTTDKSNRVCSKCVCSITKLERVLPLFMRWIEQEKAEVHLPDTVAVTQLTEEIDSKSDVNVTPVVTLEPPSKKFCPSPSLPLPLPLPPPPRPVLERSVTQVITWYPSKRSLKECDPEDAGMVFHIARKHWKVAAGLMMRNKQLVDELQLQFVSRVEKECKSLCNPNYNCMLWKSKPEDLKAFSLSKLLSDLSRISPFLLSIFSAVSNHYDPATAAAASIALRGRAPRMAAFSHHLAVILHKGGARKAVFKKLSKMAITTSHQSALLKLNEIKNYKPTDTKQNAVHMNAPVEHDISEDQGQNDICSAPISDAEELQEDDDLSSGSTSDYHEVEVTLGENDLSGDSTCDSDNAHEEDAIDEPMSDSEEPLLETDFSDDCESDSGETLRDKDNSGGPTNDSGETLRDKDNNGGPTNDSEEPLRNKDNNGGPTNGSEEPLRDKDNNGGPTNGSQEPLRDKDNRSDPTNDSQVGQ